MAPIHHSTLAPTPDRIHCCLSNGFFLQTHRLCCSGFASLCSNFCPGTVGLSLEPLLLPAVPCLHPSAQPGNRQQAEMLMGLRAYLIHPAAAEPLPKQSNGNRLNLSEQEWWLTEADRKWTHCAATAFTQHWWQTDSQLPQIRWKSLKNKQPHQLITLIFLFWLIRKKNKKKPNWPPTTPTGREGCP